MNNRRNVNIQPENGPNHLLAETQNRQINLALNRPAAPLPNLKTVNTDLIGNVYTIQDGDQTLLLLGSSAATVTFPVARANPHRILKLILRNTSGQPTIRTVEVTIVEPLPTDAISVTYQSDGQKTWNLVDYTSLTTPFVGVTSLNALTDAILLAATNNCVLSVVGNTITLDGRIGPRFGWRWPSAAQDITITDGDYGIYGTGGQGCHDVTFPLAASYPGKVVRFTYPPSGSLIPSGSDTIDAYANQTCEYMSDGVSRWVRMWSV